MKPSSSTRPVSKPSTYESLAYSVNGFTSSYVAIANSPRELYAYPAGTGFGMQAHLL